MINVNTSHVTDIEQIAPPLAKAITLPVRIEGDDFAIYVAVGAFQLRKPSDAALRKFAAAVATALKAIER